MKLVLKKPVPNLGGKMTLTVVGGNVKIWEKATKGTEITNLVFGISADKTVFVEARAISGSVRDIVLDLQYQGCKDRCIPSWREHDPLNGVHLSNTHSLGGLQGMAESNLHGSPPY